MMSLRSCFLGATQDGRKGSLSSAPQREQHLVSIGSCRALAGHAQFQSQLPILRLLKHVHQRSTELFATHALDQSIAEVGGKSAIGLEERWSLEVQLLQFFVFKLWLCRCQECPGRDNDHDQVCQLVLDKPTKHVDPCTDEHAGENCEKRSQANQPTDEAVQVAPSHEEGAPQVHAAVVSDPNAARVTPSKVSHHNKPQEAAKKQTSIIDGTHDPCCTRTIFLRFIWRVDASSLEAIGGGHVLA